MSPRFWVAAFVRPELDIFVAYPSDLSWRILDEREVNWYVANADETDLLGPVTN